MLNIEKLPEEYATGNVQKIALNGLDVGQCLEIDPHSSILMHNHDGEQWEAWIHLAKNTVYICLKDEEHELINDSDSEVVFMAIKGCFDYTYDELKEFFSRLDFEVKHGSVHITN